MKKTFCLEQKSETRTLEAKSLLPHCKFLIMSRSMENKFTNPKLTQKEIARKLRKSDSTFKRLREEKKTAFVSETRPEEKR